MPVGKIFDLVIVGGRPGGLTSGIYTMRAAPDTVLVEKGVSGGQVTIFSGIEKSLGRL